MQLLLPAVSCWGPVPAGLARQQVREQLPPACPLRRRGELEGDRQPGEPEHERKTKSMYSKLGGKAAVDAAVLEL